VTVFDVGSHGGLHYLSMEYMGEGSLADRLEKRGPLSWRQTLRMMADAAKALNFAEGRHLVHRDIKPANLMLTDAGVTKLADLGLVLDLSKDHSGGPTMGTPHFLAPEVVRGSKPSPQSDLYSLGATAYQASTGSTPFSGASSKEILRAALTTEPVPPHELDPEIPPAVSHLILALMAKDPEHRPQGAQDLLERIDRLELDLGLPAESGRGGKKWLVALALPLLAAGAYFALNSDRPAPAPAPTPGDPVSTGPSASVAEGQTTPSFDFQDHPVGDEAGQPHQDLGTEFEAQASEELKALGELDLTDSERIERLRQFAQKYRGSNSADAALTQAGSIEERMRGAERDLRLAQEAFAKEVDTLKNLALWDATQDPLHVPIAALLAFETALAAEQVESINAERMRLAIGLFGQAEGYLGDELRRIRGLLDGGDFEGARSALQREIDRFAPLDSMDFSAMNENGQAPGPVLDLRTRTQELGTLLEELPRIEAEWIIKVRAQDQVLIGTQLGRHSGFWQELKAFDLKAAQSRLHAAFEGMRSQEGRAWVSSLEQDVVRMRAYLAHWRAGYKSGDWSDKTTLDPRSERPRNEPVSGVGEDWVSLAGERIPIADFLGRTRDFRSLFEDRLKAPLGQEELEGLAALYRWQAVLSVMDQVQEMLVQSDEARFTEG
ncbi:MAG: serine/threonine protein kinase, partial [Planctomycetes bacterium]|nr:serine/threonine protein kinase [Planctomycetota bacterium]